MSYKFAMRPFLVCALSAAPLGALAKPDVVLHQFPVKRNQYSGPRAGLIEGPNGVLYGTWTGSDMQKQSQGAVFSLTPPEPGKQKWTYAIIHNFGSGVDGRRPYAGVVMDLSGALYGTTSGSGSGGSNASLIFKLSPPTAGQTTWTETILFTFPSEVDPYGSLLLSSNGALYGTAALGGTANKGQVFLLSPPTGGTGKWLETTLYSFQGGSDGVSPEAAVIQDSSGALYGTTLGGGVGRGENCQTTGCGTVFKLTPPAAPGGSLSETQLYAFSGVEDGANPQGSLLFGAGGSLYGSASYGGTGQGVIFALTPPADGQSSWNESAIVTFPSSGALGTNPYSGLVSATNGNLYGTTPAGGGEGSCCGTVFQLNPPMGGGGTWTITTLENFTGKDGFFAEGNLLLDQKGNLFGTTVLGGKSNGGTVFEIKDK